MANVLPVEAATRSRVAFIPCILDDDPDQLEMMSAVIASLGYDPIATADPLKALEVVRQGRCRLVLADIRMPGMDGYKFLEKALQLDPGVNVILTTGDYSLESAIDAIRRGAYDFLPKRSEEHTSELQSLAYLVCRLLLEKKKKQLKVN